MNGTRFRQIENEKHLILKKEKKMREYGQMDSNEMFQVCQKSLPIPCLVLLIKILCQRSDLVLAFTLFIQTNLEKANVLIPEMHP